MENPQKKQTKSYSFETAMVFLVALELGFIIALPLVLLGLAGKWLDGKYNTHLFVYLGIVLALISSTMWLYKRFAEFVEKLKQASEHKEQPQAEQKDKN